jgi:hypothetical protein
MSRWNFCAGKHEKNLGASQAPPGKWSAEDLPARWTELNQRSLLRCDLLKDREPFKNWHSRIDPIFINAGVPILYSSFFFVEKNVKFGNSSANH